jgi:thioredoxin reductase
MNHSNSNRSTYVDYLIVGAGPAGLQLAYFLDRAGRNYMVVDTADRPGTFFEKYPRHNKLISINKVHTGYEDRESQLRYDWNSLLSDNEELAFTKYSKEYFPSAKLYAQYLRDYAAKLGLRVRYNTRIAEVTRCHDGYNFEVADEKGSRYACRALVVATGLWDAWTPDIPGIELTENYTDFSIDPDDYNDQRVLILGKGNSAFETADALVGATRVTHVCSPNPIKMAWKTHFFGHLRAVNNNFLDTYILKGQNSVLDADIERIEKRGDEYIVDLAFSHAEGQRAQFAYDRVLVCTGFKWNDSFFPKHCKPESTECGRLPKMTSAWESTNLPHLFYAGTLMQMRDRHKTMSNVLHGFRFNVKSLSCILGARYENEPWPSEELPRCPKSIAKKIIERVSTNAGLMHQPGFLADLLVVSDDKAEYFETLSVDYIHDSCFSESADYFVVTMEYGDTLDDILAVRREPDPNKAYNDFYLHPRVQHFQRGKKVGDHHMSESLENEWRLDEHPGCRPLIRKMEFHGQADATQFQQTHFGKLAEYLACQLTAACPTEAC